MITTQPNSESSIIKQKDPPQRHRGHRDDPEFADEHGFDFILWVLCVSVVKTPEALRDRMT
jgi:hypothetical protein